MLVRFCYVCGGVMEVEDHFIVDRKRVWRITRFMCPICGNFEEVIRCLP